MQLVTAGWTLSGFPWFLVCVQVPGMSSALRWATDKVFTCHGVFNEQQYCSILMNGDILFLHQYLSAFLLRKLGFHQGLWIISVVFANRLHMKEVFILDSLFPSNLNVVEIDEEILVNPLSALKPRPNANLFNSVLLWSLASTFGLWECFSPSYTVVTVVSTGGNWLPRIFPMFESCMVHNFYLDPNSLRGSTRRNREKCDNNS